MHVVVKFPATTPVLPIHLQLSQSDDQQSGSNSTKKPNLTTAKNVVDIFAPAPLRKGPTMAAVVTMD
jgi:hypothetical protein